MPRTAHTTRATTVVSTSQGATTRRKPSVTNSTRGVSSTTRPGT